MSVAAEHLPLRCALAARGTVSQRVGRLSPLLQNYATELGAPLDLSVDQPQSAPADSAPAALAADSPTSARPHVIVLLSSTNALTQSKTVIDAFSSAQGPDESAEGDKALVAYLETADVGGQPAAPIVERARRWLRAVAGYLAADERPWIDPHVSLGAHGDLVLEWWAGSRKVTVFFDDEGTEFLRSWGASLSTEMDDGPIHEACGMLNLWHWLFERSDD